LKRNVKKKKTSNNQLIKYCYPELFAHKVVAVQPMTSPVGLAYALRYAYGKFFEIKQFLTKYNIDAYNCNLKEYKEVKDL